MPPFCVTRSSSCGATDYNYGNTAQLCLRAAAVFLPHFFSLKNEKYIQYSFVFQTLN